MSGEKKRILIIDDSELGRMIIKRVIQSPTHELIESGHGEDALDKMRSEHFDLVILDLLMPEISGLDVLETMQAENITFPVLVTTADIQNSSREKCTLLGVKGFINKPIKEKELSTKVDQILQGV